MTKKNIILCDVSGTLIVDRIGPNTQLISLLNKAHSQGYEIRLVSCSHHTMIGRLTSQMLKEANFNAEILANTDDKENITSITYENVKAIIDDDMDEEYIPKVKIKNPEALYFKPDQIDLLANHLGIAQQKPTSSKRR